mmetsp:Transcript_39316/g.29033  ORF Transcript_39316/g.29033 Transcript_39316/m.29033 type:complete len:93 (+) Transcript_39316:254-532(+)
MDDVESEEAFFREFEQMFATGDLFRDLEDMESFLQMDDKLMNKVFRDLGASYRTRGKRRKQGKRAKDRDMEEMMTMFMMPGMGLGMNLSDLD